MPYPHRLYLAAVLGVIPTPGRQVSAAREVRLASVEAISHHDFTQIRGLRELPDGRLLVSDRLEPALWIVDLTRDSVVKIGREGGGPGEYRMPATLVALPGDSTLLIDEGNARFLILGPDLKVHHSTPSQRSGMVFSLWPRGADSRGRLYFQVPGWASGPNRNPNDSVVVARIDLGSGRVDTLARIKGYTDPGPIKRGLPNVPFSPEDVWQVTPAGRIALVRSGDYHVEWLDPDGRVLRGAPVPYTALPVTKADRLLYTRNFLENSSIGGRATAGTGPSGLSATPDDWLTPARIAELAEVNRFATRKPGFTDAAPRMAPDGMLWVEHSVPAGSPRSYDVFDSSARQVLRVTLPEGRRLLAVGRAGLYLVSTNPDGLETLERYQIPR